jgi:hypothetical protein
MSSTAIPSWGPLFIITNHPWLWIIIMITNIATFQCMKHPPTLQPHVPLFCINGNYSDPQRRRPNELEYLTRTARYCAFLIIAIRFPILTPFLVVALFLG